MLVPRSSHFRSSRLSIVVFVAIVIRSYLIQLEATFIRSSLVCMVVFVAELTIAGDYATAGDTGFSYT